MEVAARCTANKRWTIAHIPDTPADNYQLVCRNDLVRLYRAHGWGRLGSYCPGDALFRRHQHGDHPGLLRHLEEPRTGGARNSAKTLLGKLDLEGVLIQTLEAFSE